MAVKIIAIILIINEESMKNNEDNTLIIQFDSPNYYLCNNYIFNITIIILQ